MYFRIKRIIKISAKTLLSVFFSCSIGLAPEDDNIDPPFSYESILPLQLGHNWNYEFFIYGSKGELLSSNSNLILSIDRAWEILDNGTLEPIGYDRKLSDTVEACFGYEWEHQEKGLIVTCFKRDTIPGIYILGTYIADSISLFDKPRLWLAYPADQGFSYLLNTDPASDSSKSVKMEVISVKEPFYFPEEHNQNATGLSFMDCYLYKATSGDTISFYYYHKEYGALGYQQIYHNQLRKSYILRSLRTR